ncbi:hypothetical protein ACQKNB_09665 [Lysinibacillus xylanilyticus]|uniref:hypothetical protein n=1 Tax=Lysinibacillus xylanilyticus TaxID=582475 RepID=UPI003D074D91
MPKSDILYLILKANQQLQNVFCAKAKRQQQMSSVAKAKRPLQLLEKCSCIFALPKLYRC